MGNMGTIPATGYESSIVQTFSSPTGTSHTMTYAANVSDMVLVINNVIQEPTVAFTTSGTTLTTATLVSGDTMYIIYLALSRKTVTPGADTVTNAMIVDNAINSEHYTDASIDNAHLADDAVGLDELSATGTPSSSMFLRGDNSWAAAGGAWNLIGTSVASSSASLTQTGITSTYDTYVLVLADMVPATDEVDAQMQIGDSSGIDTGGSDYKWHTSYIADVSAAYNAENSTGASSIKISKDCGSDTAEGLSATIFLGNPSDTSLMNLIYGTAAASRHAGDVQLSIIVGRRQTSIAITQVLFKFESGNIESGRMSLYGISHA